MVGKNSLSCGQSDHDGSFPHSKSSALAAPSLKTLPDVLRSGFNKLRAISSNESPRPTSPSVRSQQSRITKALIDEALLLQKVGSCEEQLARQRHKSKSMSGCLSRTEVASGEQVESSERTVDRFILVSVHLHCRGGRVSQVIRDRRVVICCWRRVYRPSS